MSLVPPTTPELDPAERETIDAYYHFVDPTGAQFLEFLTDDFVEYEAQGAMVRDRHGRSYIDGMTTGGVFGLGHRNPRVIEAVKAQLDRMPLSAKIGFNQPHAELSRLLAEITPGDLKYTFVVSSGTEAIESALKLARLTTQRPGIVSTNNSFHGMSIGCSSVSGVPYWREGFFPLLEGCQLVPYGDVDAIERFIGPLTAAVLVEVVQSASGCTVAPPGYLKRMRELCDKHGTLMIVDEIQTAFGRTGKMFAVEHEGVVPDILCLGKFLGGGVVAAGACVYNERVHRASAQRPAFNNTTWTGNPLVCTAAVAAIRTVIDDNLVEHSAKLGAYLRAGLEHLKSKHPTTVVDLKGLGLMQTFVLADPRQGLPLVMNLIQKERILLFSPVHAPTMVRVNPPQIVDEAFIDDMLARIDRALTFVGGLDNEGLNRFMVQLTSDMQARKKTRLED